MNNDVNENNTFENPPKISIYKINILASVENANINENVNVNINEENINKKKRTNSKKNLLFLDTNSNKKKLKKNNIKNIFESSFRSKRTSFQEKEKNEDDNPKDEPPKIIVVNNSGNENSKKDSEFLSHSFMSHRSKNKLNENNNENELNLCKLADQLYENEEHFQKNIISKKGDFDTLNTIKKNDSFISEEIIKKKYKNRFFLNEESICKDNSNANLLKELNDKNKEYKGRKSNVSSSSKGKSSNYNFKRSRKKNGSSNFKKLKIKNEIEKKEDGGEDKNKIRKAPKLSNDMINNSRTFKENISAKLLRMNASKQSVYENNEIKGKNNKKKSPNKINNNKSKIITDDTKNENENIKNKKKDSKGKKFSFFCCLNNNGNDSDEFCN